MTCIVCFEDIKLSASRCHHCGSFQKRWKNWLPIIGIGSVIATFVVSIFVTILSPATDLWDEHFGKEAIEIVAYSSQGGITILNTGDKRVLIENVTQEISEYHGRVFHIQDVVNKNEIYSNKKLPKFRDTKGAEYILNLTDERLEKIKLGNERNNVFPVFFSENHPNLKTMQDRMGKSLRTIEGKCTVRYRSVEIYADSMYESFPCVGLLLNLNPNR